MTAGDAAGPGPVPTPSAGREKRDLWTVVIALLLGAGALWGASGLVWIEVPQGRTVDGRLADDFTGGELVQWPVPIALLALAAVAATLALRGLTRRVLGALLAVAGGWTVYLAVAGGTRDIAWSGWAPGYEGATAQPAWMFWGPAAAAAGGAVIALAGMVLVWRGHRMARMGAKYSAPGDRRAASDPDTELWDALSEGDDPTDRENSETARKPADGENPTGSAGNDAGNDARSDVTAGDPAGADGPRDGRPE